MGTKSYMVLSKLAARNLMLAAQGLDRRPDRPAKRSDVLKIIRKMGVLQIDTIHVVARSPYIVLWSRLGDYEPTWLEELLAEGALFEYWAHEASFVPIEDFPLYRHRMINAANMGWKYRQEWVDAHRDELDRLLSIIRERGPVRSAEFERTDGKGGGWWEWKPEKRALEMLFTSGDLMVCRRHNFQRVYDLRERVLSSWNDSMLSPAEEADRALVLKAVKALGISSGRWIADYFRMKKKSIGSLVSALVDEGSLLTVQVDGWKEPAYIHPDNRRLARQATDGLEPSLTTLLSPFDPVVWDRARAKELFDFDYRIECYTPASKRRYGYFTLPILRRGELIGRLDPKAHRKEGVFEVKALHLEPCVKVTDELIADLAGALKEVASWHKTPEIIVRLSDPPKLTKLLRQSLK